jgi:hypothetical protein
MGTEQKKWEQKLGINRTQKNTNWDGNCGEIRATKHKTFLATDCESGAALLPFDLNGKS